jgi:hypothetical protein
VVALKFPRRHRLSRRTEFQASTSCFLGSFPLTLRPFSLVILVNLAHLPNTRQQRTNRICSIVHAVTETPRQPVGDNTLSVSVVWKSTRHRHRAYAFGSVRAIPGFGSSLIGWGLGAGHHLIAQLRTSMLHDQPQAYRLHADGPQKSMPHSQHTAY